MSDNPEKQDSSVNYEAENAALKARIAKSVTKTNREIVNLEKTRSATSQFLSFSEMPLPGTSDVILLMNIEIPLGYGPGFSAVSKDMLVKTLTDGNSGVADFRANPDKGDYFSLQHLQVTEGLASREMCDKIRTEFARKLKAALPLAFEYNIQNRRELTETAKNKNSLKPIISIVPDWLHPTYFEFVSKYQYTHGLIESGEMLVVTSYAEAMGIIKRVCEQRVQTDSQQSTPDSGEDKSGSVTVFKAPDNT